MLILSCMCEKYVQKWILICLIFNPITCHKVQCRLIIMIHGIKTNFPSFLSHLLSCLSGVGVTKRTSGAKDLYTSKNYYFSKQQYCMIDLHAIITCRQHCQMTLSLLNLLNVICMFKHRVNFT